MEVQSNIHHINCHTIYQEELLVCQTPPPQPPDSLLHYEDHPSLLGVIHLLVSNHTIVAGFLLVLQ